MGLKKLASRLRIAILNFRCVIGKGRELADVGPTEQTNDRYSMCAGDIQFLPKIILLFVRTFHLWRVQ